MHEFLLNCTPVQVHDDEEFEHGFEFGYIRCKTSTIPITDDSLFNLLTIVDAQNRRRLAGYLVGVVYALLEREPQTPRRLQIVGKISAQEVEEMPQ
jgi:hypothetical protein